MTTPPPDDLAALEWRPVTLPSGTVLHICYECRVLRSGGRHLADCAWSRLLEEVRTARPLLREALAIQRRTSTGRHGLARPPGCDCADCRYERALAAFTGERDAGC